MKQSFTKLVGNGLDRSVPICRWLWHGRNLRANARFGDMRARQYGLDRSVPICRWLWHGRNLRANARFDDMRARQYGLDRSIYLIQTRRGLFSRSVLIGADEILRRLAVDSE